MAIGLILAIIAFIALMWYSIDYGTRSESIGCTVESLNVSGSRYVFTCKEKPKQSFEMTNPPLVITQNKPYAIRYLVKDKNKGCIEVREMAYA